MFGLQALQMCPEKVLTRLKAFELFCLGERQMSPEQFETINAELSISAVLHIGERRFQKDVDGKHLLWTGLDSREYDLGPIHNLNVTKDYPGFHRSRTLSLGHDQVVDNQVIDVPPFRRKVTIVKMEDGSTGVAPNYRLALRNAALKMHLKAEFMKNNQAESWKKIYGNA